MTVHEILSAAERLDPDEFVLLREELDRLEQRLWETELAESTREMDQANLTDDQIDYLVARRRREGRSWYDALGVEVINPAEFERLLPPET